MREPASNLEWQRFGKLDVGVSHEYDSGLAEWAILKSHLQHYGLWEWKTACEIGCGAGRMTNAAAADFDVVHALDVSEERIAQARSAPNAAKCVFHRVSEPAIPMPDGSCDLVYSIHVFQHLSSERAVLEYFCEIRRVLKPRGVLLIHLPMVGAHGRTGNFLEVWTRGIKETVKRTVLIGCRLLIKIVPGRYHLPLARYRVFSFVTVAEKLSKIGFEQMEMRLLPVRDYHSYVFARKPAV